MPWPWWDSRFDVQPAPRLLRRLRAPRTFEASGYDGAILAFEHHAPGMIDQNLALAFEEKDLHLFDAEGRRILPQAR
jgi:hypothetical protein